MIGSLENDKFIVRLFLAKESFLPTGTYCVAHGTLPSVLWQPGWEGVWGRKDTCVCMSEFHPCTPETVTTLLIDYMPIENKKFFKKRVASLPQEMVS